MLHSDKNEFLKMLERTAAQTGFPLRLLEKDYYLSLIVSDMCLLSKDLVLKGGTCLSKVYYSYYRLSEDLDFTLKSTDNKPTRVMRRCAIKPIKQQISTLAGKYGMTIEELNKGGHRESTQYIYHLAYDSTVVNTKDSIKLEIGMRSNPLLSTVTKKVHHRFIHPFTHEPLFDTGTVNCLALDELVAEKLRAAATRHDIASRDFYDLGFLLRRKFDFTSVKQLGLFKKKLEEDNFSSDLKRYRVNLGRPENEIKEMISRIEDELFPILTLSEQKCLDMIKILDEINTLFHDIE